MSFKCELLLCVSFVVFVWERSVDFASLNTAGDCDGSWTERLAKILPGEAESNKDQQVLRSPAHDVWTGGQKKSQREGLEVIMMLDNVEKSQFTLPVE